MWKYVSRRIKDTVEKTYNVLDATRTWSCGGTGEKICPLTDASSVEQQSPQEKEHKRKLILCILSSNNNGTNSSSSSGNEGYNENIGANHHQRLNNTWVGALTWSSAIICGWYASQLLCLQRRHFGWDNRCVYSKVLFTPSRAFHNNLLSHLAYTAPVNSSRRPIYANTNNYGVGSPTAAKTTKTAEQDLIDEQFTAQKIIFDNCDVTDGRTTAKEAGDKPPTKTVETAVKELLCVLGDIEYQLGIQNIATGHYRTAVSHLKLATSHQHAGATFNLGICYEQGLGVDKDLKMAMECYQSASELGHPKAMYNLGVFYVQGLGGLKRNRSAARNYFLAAAKLGQPEAKQALGISTPPPQPPSPPLSPSKPNNEKMNKNFITKKNNINNKKNNDGAIFVKELQEHKQQHQQQHHPIIVS